MEDLLGENLKKIRLALNMSQEEFADFTNIGRTTYASYEQGRARPKTGFAMHIGDLFQVSFRKFQEEHITDKKLSEIQYRFQDKIKRKPELDDPNVVRDLEVKRLHKPKVPEKLELPEKAIPVFEVSASAGMVGGFNDINQQKGSIIVPGYEDCDFAIYAFGHSMYPVIENGCLVLCRRINDKTLILWGEIYFIRTRDHQVIKRIQKSEKKAMVTLMSDNEEKRKDKNRRYESQDVPLDAILDLYIIKGVIKKIQI